MVLGCGGTAMIARLKQALPDTAIVVPGLPEEKTDREALRGAGADDAGSKFASPTELLPVIQSACESRKHRRAQESAAAFHSLINRALK